MVAPVDVIEQDAHTGVPHMLPDKISCSLRALVINHVDMIDCAVDAAKDVQNVALYLKAGNDSSDSNGRPKLGDGAQIPREANKVKISKQMGENPLVASAVRNTCFNLPFCP